MRLPPLRSVGFHRVSCSFIETPGVFEISKDPAIFFEHESHESYECMSLETPPVFEISRVL